jgi:hypothetical protein
MINFYTYLNLKLNSKFLQQYSQILQVLRWGKNDLVPFIMPNVIYNKTLQYSIELYVHQKLEIIGIMNSCINKCRKIREI